MDSLQYELYKKMSTNQRASIGFNLHDFAYQRMKIYLRQRMPNASAEQIQKELLKRFLGESAAIFHKSTKNT
jgi:hypothetical protein